MFKGFVGVHYVIEFTLGSNAEAKIRAVWTSLAEEGITRRTIDLGGWPHVTVTSSAPFALDNISEDFISLARSIQPFEIAFSHLGVFGGNGLTLFLGVTHTAMLMALHRRFFELVSPLAEVFDFAKPDTVVFHSTLGSGIRPQDLGRAMEFAYAAPLPRKVLVEGFNVVGYEPAAKKLKSFAFGNHASV